LFVQCSISRILEKMRKLTKILTQIKIQYIVGIKEFLLDQNTLNTVHFV
jgi:hypothetical protein